MKRALISALAVPIATSLLCACGGRLLTPTRPQSATAGATVRPDAARGYLLLKLVIPSIGPSVIRRAHPGYVSSDTRQVAIAINGSPLEPKPVNGACSYDSQQRLVCSVNFFAPAGNDRFQIHLLDGSGKIISQGAVQKTVVANTTVPLHLTFHGVPRFVQLAIDVPNPPVGTPSVAHLTIHAFDVDANEIIGDAFANAIRISNGDKTGNVTLSASTITHPNVNVTVRYSGRLVQPVVIRVVSPRSTSDTGAAFAPDATVVVPLRNQYQPQYLAVGPDGTMWFTECALYHSRPHDCRIGRIDRTGAIWQSAIVGVAERIVNGPDGAMWFTALDQPFVGRIDKSGHVRFIRVAVLAPHEGFQSGAIAAGSDGNIWMTEYEAIDKITPAGNVTRYFQPTTLTETTHLIPGPDGALWFNERTAIGRIATDGTARYYDIPQFKARSNWWGLTLGRDRRFHFIESDPNLGVRLGSLSTSGQFSFAPFPRSVTIGRAVTEGPDGSRWGPAIVCCNPLLDFPKIVRIEPDGAVRAFYSKGTDLDTWQSAAWDGYRNLWFTTVGKPYLTRFHLAQ